MREKLKYACLELGEVSPVLVSSQLEAHLEGKTIGGLTNIQGKKKNGPANLHTHITLEKGAKLTQQVQWRRNLVKKKVLKDKILEIPGCRN